MQVARGFYGQSQMKMPQLQLWEESREESGRLWSVSWPYVGPISLLVKRTRQVITLCEAGCHISTLRTRSVTQSVSTQSVLFCVKIANVWPGIVGDILSRPFPVPVGLNWFTDIFVDTVVSGLRVDVPPDVRDNRWI